MKLMNKTVLSAALMLTTVSAARADYVCQVDVREEVAVKKIVYNKPAEDRKVDLSGPIPADLIVETRDYNPQWMPQLPASLKDFGLETSLGKTQNVVYYSVTQHHKGIVNVGSCANMSCAVTGKVDDQTANTKYGFHYKSNDKSYDTDVQLAFFAIKPKNTDSISFQMSIARYARGLKDQNEFIATNSGTTLQLKDNTESFSVNINTQPDGNSQSGWVKEVTDTGNSAQFSGNGLQVTAQIDCKKI